MSVGMYDVCCAMLHSTDTPKQTTQALPSHQLPAGCHRSHLHRQWRKLFHSRSKTWKKRGKNTEENLFCLFAGQPWVECWLVREWCSRGCLTDAIMKGFLQSDPNTKSGPDEVAVLATAAEVASALTYLHGQGYLHGDLTGDW